MASSNDHKPTIRRDRDLAQIALILAAVLIIFTVIAQSFPAVPPPMRMVRKLTGIIGPLLAYAGLSRIGLRLWCARRNETAETPQVSPFDRTVCLSLTALITFGFLFDIVTCKEHFPFTNMPMYANWHYRSQFDHSSAKIFGVLADDASTEIPLTDDAIYAPFHSAMEFLPLEKVGVSKNLSAAESRLQALSWLSVQYNRLHKDDPQKYPALKALRWYQYDWHVDKTKMPTAVTQQRKLLTEVAREQ